MSARRTVAAALVALLCAAVAAAALVSRDGDGAREQPLDEALGALGAAPPFEGITADFTVVNRLLPDGASRSPLSGLLAAGASGTVWIAADGRFRLDVGASIGRVRLVSDGRRAWITVPLLPAVAVFPLPRDLRLSRPTPAALRELLRRLGRFASFSAARATTTADRPTRTVRIRPRDDGGLLGAAEVAWDAARGIPLRAALFTPSDDEPVLEIRADSVRYGAVDEQELAIRAPAGVPRIDGARSGTAGVPALPAGAPALPRALAGLRRTGAQRLPRGGVGLYGTGLGTLVALQIPFGGSVQELVGPALELPEINVEGATGVELPTALGTAVAVVRDRKLHLVAGLVPPLVAENAARDLVRGG